MTVHTTFRRTLDPGTCATKHRSPHRRALVRPISESSSIARWELLANRHTANWRSLAVQQELEQRADEADRLRRTQVERARYEAELARRRFMRVDPDNRLVADSLESEWNEKLRLHAQAQQEYERQRQADTTDEQQRTEIMALATDFPLGTIPRRSRNANAWLACHRGHHFDQTN
jgi:hypothetical protein